ncbi:hypothetical protein DDD63_11455 [Actinobaculum sp. 313]|nr:hypothetical protein DDD63_11455 [Actinobaculum sp. 313]
MNTIEYSPQVTGQFTTAEGPHWLDTMGCVGPWLGKLCLEHPHLFPAVTLFATVLAQAKASCFAYMQARNEVASTYQGLPGSLE